MDRLRVPHIGILTFHSQLNYGGVLQAFALQTALGEAGYEAVMVDRWLSPSNSALLGPLRAGSVKTKVKTLLYAFLGLGMWGRLCRHERTIRFVREKLRLTPYHFCDWKDCPEGIRDLDVLVVGSDQVWHCGDWGNPLPYLLVDAPPMKAITYAASFGMRAIPDAMKQHYIEGFKKFAAISVREAEGVQLVAPCGATATHVVDPTLLLEPAIWQTKVSPKKRKRPLLVCYFLSESIPAALPHLEAFARAHKCDVRILSDGHIRPFPKTPKSLINHIAWALKRWMSPVTIDNTSGPQEFLDLFAQASWVLSDSFHAMMFSSIFDKQFAFLRPKSTSRQAMFARVEEFVRTTTHGPVIEGDLSAALARFANGGKMAYNHEAIAARRAASWQWLKTALKG